MRQKHKEVLIVFILGSYKPVFSEYLTNIKQLDSILKYIKTFFYGGSSSAAILSPIGSKGGFATTLLKPTIIDGGSSSKVEYRTVAADSCCRYPVIWVRFPAAALFNPINLGNHRHH